MSTLPLSHSRSWVGPGLVIAVLALTAAGLVTMAMVQLVAAAGPVLLAAVGAVLVVWVVRAVRAAGVVSWVVLLVCLLAVSPWLAGVVLVWLALHIAGGGPDA